MSETPIEPEIAAIPAGEFVMGSPKGEAGRNADERKGPKHPVAQATQLLISGEVDICPTWSSRVQTAKDQGAPVEIMWNQNTWGVGCWSIIKGTPKADLCREFIAFASQAKCQAIMGNENVNGPVNPEAYRLIDPARAEMLPSAPDHISRSIQVNEAFWAENADKAIERFTAWLIA